MKGHIIRHARSTRSLFVTYRSHIITASCIGLLSVILVQVFYPSSRLLPLTDVDGVSMSGWHKSDAAWELNSRYENTQVNIYFGEVSTPQKSLKPADIGLTLRNDERVDSLTYPWYIKIVPTSLIWYGKLQNADPPKTEQDEAVLATYIKKSIGNSCDIQPQNATLKADNTSLRVIEAVSGGVCDTKNVENALKDVDLSLEKPAVVKVNVKAIEPSITTQKAVLLKQRIESRIANGIPLKVNNETTSVAADTVRGWLAFDSSKRIIEVTFDTKKAANFFNKSISPKVTKLAGITKITTRDFTVLSKNLGSKGRVINISKTESDIVAYITQNADTPTVSTKAVNPKIDYTRTYTKTSIGISALLAQYAADNPGTYGVSFQEIGGSNRSGQYNGNKSYTTASTYKLFVAYGTLRNVDSGKWKWSDKNIVGGRTLAKCFDDMIVLSDNACAEALLKKLGFSQLTNDIRSLGLYNSGFVSGSTPNTTANDLALYLKKLQTNQLPIKSDSRATLLDAMGRQVYRQGIPAGASGRVADKVGFLWELLHDASIVYSPKGTYVLVVMTDGSTWTNIAELTRKIEALR